jgi:2-polyprenyl-3-methyl-5-hydroxy-6-metoxy-1,4-benzoquinol methylase
MKTTKGWDWDHALTVMPERWTEVAEEIFPFTARLKAEGLRKVCDLGCGVGRHTVFLAEQGFHVTASDVSDSAIAHTRSRLRDHGVDADLHQMDMLDWKFSEHAFDSLIAFNVVYHATRSQVEAVLEAIERSLRPGGLIFITFKSTLDSECGQGRKLAPFTYAPTSGVEEGVPHYYVDEAEAKRLLSRYELVSLVHKQELPVSTKSERLRAHWVVWARKRVE